MFVLLCILACISPRPPTEPEAGVAENSEQELFEEKQFTDAIPLGTLAQCIEDCKKQNMARAIAWDMILADCQRSCDADFIQHSRDVTLNSGKRVNVKGQLKRHPMTSHDDGERGTAILLEDDTPVWVLHGPPPLMWRTFIDQTIILKGTLLDSSPDGSTIKPTWNIATNPHLVDWEEPKIAEDRAILQAVDLP
jgi:hypothetical protein